MTSYMRIGEKGTQIFYGFVESMRKPQEDPLIFHFPGGPGASFIIALLNEEGPLQINPDSLILTLNPGAWTQMANMIFVDMPAGTGFSYSETQEGWVSSDTILATDYIDLIKKFLIENPKFLKNPLYISGISYNGIIVPKVILGLYEGNERGDLPAVNIQGYILCSPLTNKFMDFNSRFEYAHRMALISDDVYQSAINNCNGNYVDIMRANSACIKSLQSYEEVRSINTSIKISDFVNLIQCWKIQRANTLAINAWANMEVVQQALNVRQGMVEKFVSINSTLHYRQGKNDTFYYVYDIFSSFSYHKKLSTKSCQALIFNGDHDLTFPYVGVEQWIASLNLEVEAPWKPFYVDSQVGGYVTKYAQNNYSLTYATVKGAGHSVTDYKRKESFELVQMWISSQTYSSDS
ncbi:hypothetical protein R6Q59_007388 [Mikania micrantha]